MKLSHSGPPNLKFTELTSISICLLTKQLLTTVRFVMRFVYRERGSNSKQDHSVYLL